jgi:hypothetical protein
MDSMDLIVLLLTVVLAFTALLGAAWLHTAR